MTKTFLDTDFTKVSGQNYALISIVEPNEKLNSLKENQCALKIKGCFDSIDNAKAWAKKLQEEDNSFNIYLVDMYSWLLIPPDQEKIEDVQYRDEMLNKIIGGRKEEERKANAMFQQYKNEMQEAGKNEMFTKQNPETSSSQKPKTQEPETPDPTPEEPKTPDPTPKEPEKPEPTPEVEPEKPEPTPEVEPETPEPTPEESEKPEPTPEVESEKQEPTPEVESEKQEPTPEPTPEESIKGKKWADLV